MKMDQEQKAELGLARCAAKRADRENDGRPKRGGKRMADPVMAFWDLFRKRAPELALAESADAPVYDELLDKLHQVSPGLYLEYCADPRERELIVTADGNAEFFPTARSLVSSAPSIDGWNVRALKPRMGFPEAVRWEDTTLAIDAIRFVALEREGTDDLGLRILVPDLAPTKLDDAHNAILRAIDHALGEEKHAASIHHTEVAPLPTGTVEDDCIPLSELEKYIDWRAARQRDPG